MADLQMAPPGTFLAFSWCWPKHFNEFDDDDLLPLNEVQTVRLGATDVPRRFSVNIWDTDTNEHRCTLMFEADSETGVRLAGLYSPAEDVLQAFAWARSKQSVSWWARWAVMQWVFWVVDKDGHDPFAPRLGLDEDQALEMLEKAEKAPITRRRNRLTPSFLKEVARVYLEAEEAGLPPTRAVADRLANGTHSTAAKWVARARSEGHLPPVETSGAKR